MAALSQSQQRDIINVVVGLFDAAPGAAIFNDLATYYLSRPPATALLDLTEVLVATPQFQSLYSNGLTNAQFANKWVDELLEDAVVAPSEKQWAKDWITGQLNGGATRAEVTLLAIQALDAIPHTDPVWGNAAKAFDNQVDVASYYTIEKGLSDSTLAGLQAVIAGVSADQATVDAAKANIDFAPGTLFSLTSATGAGLNIMRITGDQDVRIDFTNPNNQIRGLDLNGDGIIQNNGKENAIGINSPVLAKNFVAVDAYPRNPLDETDRVSNFRGDIFFDGTGFAGDGKSTNGNIVLGGFGADRIYGGIGNDFLVPGGVAADVVQKNFELNLANAGLKLALKDELYGGRNADFAFVDVSALDVVGGTGLFFDGGETADDFPGTQTSKVDRAGTTNDRDWVLVEASDDDEPTTIELSDTAGSVATSSGGTGSAILEGVEAVDASGNLYGFLNDFEVTVGARAYDGYADMGKHTPGTVNYGRGSTAQLLIFGSDSANIVVGGYDNDTINGKGGNDILFGGNLGFLLRNRNNPNLLDDNGGLKLNVNGAGVVTDGLDVINGGDDNDAIVFEAASGKIDGGNHFDTLYLTNMSVGRLVGTTAAADDATAQADALAALTTDSTIRLDLANGFGGQYRDYGGANRGLGLGPVEAPTADQTNYVAALGAKPATTVTSMSGVITTGLGDIDYRAAGSNSPETLFDNQQNYLGANARLDVRGVNSDGISTTKFGNYWTDENFGLVPSGNPAAGQPLTNNAGGGAFLGAKGQVSTGIPFRDDGDNVIYLSGGNDTIEGRAGDDEMGGGPGDDNFLFTFKDGTDIIRRQKDANGDNLWDKDAAGNFLYTQDFRADPSGIAATTLLIDFLSTDLTSPNVAVAQVQLVLNPGTANAITLSAGNLSSLKSIGAIAAAVNTAYQAIDPAISVVAVGNALLVTDTKGRDISDTVPEGYLVAVAIGNASASTQATLNPGGQVLQENDRIIYVDYANRLNNTWVDDTKDHLGQQPQDLVVGLGPNTTLAYGQQWNVLLQNLQPGDKVAIDINGTVISRTVANGQNTAGFVAALVTQVNTQILDIYTGAGHLLAGSYTITGSGDDGVITFSQNAIGNGENKVYMNEPTVTITAANQATSSASWQIANVSSHSVELFGFNGANGNLNPDTVLFLGRSGQASLSSSKNTAILQVAKDAGETITGKDAVVVLIPSTGKTGNTDSSVAFPLYQAINGDDQLIGGLGDDVLIGGTGDDRFVGSWGKDTIKGGGSATAPNGEVIRFVDSILFEENTFGAGTKFTITPSASLDAVGEGTVTAVLGSKTGTTTYEGIEEIRTASNTAQDTLDVSGLSNSVAAATGASANRDQTTVDSDASIGAFPNPANNYNDSLLVRLTQTNAGIFWAADRNGDDDTKDAGETGKNPTAVFGVENVKGGNANDIVVMDQTQAGSQNLIELGGQQPDLTPAGNFTEGADRVVYNHASLLAKDRPVMTVTVESAGNTHTVSMTGGALGSKSVVDTLVDVEELDVAAAATASGVQKNITLGDVLNVSSIGGGATVNFSAVGITVGKALGGGLPATSVANVEANTLEAGGVSKTGTGLGNELLEITGIAQFEQVLGGAGNDRVILGKNIEASNANVNAGIFGPDDVPFKFFDNYNVATRTYPAYSNKNIALFTFDLGAGDDVLDYRAAGLNGIAVTVDFGDGTEGDYISVDTNNDNFFEDRVDRALNVERYFGSDTTSNRGNIIDASRATEGVNVLFGFESSASGNEFKDPNGSTTTDSVTSIKVGTASNPTAALFMNADALNGMPQSYWNWFYGTNFNDVVTFSPFQDRTSTNILVLRGGSNDVDYTNGVVAGKNDAYTLFVGPFTPTKGSTASHGNWVTHNSLDDPGTIDFISVDRQYDLTGAPVDGALRVIGSSNTSDTVNIILLGAPTVATGVTGTKFGTSTQVDEVSNFTDITGNVGGGHHRVDLGTGFGVTSGQVIQDVTLNLVGGETDFAAPASNPVFNANVVTGIKGFERITGSNFSDRLFGNDGDNIIDAGTGNDLVQGRGGGDLITVGGGDDRVVYTGAGDTGHFNTPSIPQLVATNFDEITDFDSAGNDLLVIDRVAGWSKLFGSGIIDGVIGAAKFDANQTTGMILFTDDDVLTLANYTNMTSVVTALGASANVLSAPSVTKGQQAIFALDATSAVAIYVWTASSNGDGTINDNEIQLLTVLSSNNDIDTAANEAANKFTVLDVASRFSAAAGQQKDQLLLPGLREEIVYTSLGQSQYGAIDSFGKHVAGGVTGQFVGGEDKIDLSAFNLGAQGALAINAARVIDRTGGANFITDANANNFFVDAGGVRRAVVIEYDNDDFDGVLAGTQGRARLFVDLDGDGQLDTTKDLFIDFATSGGVVLTAVGFGSNGAPGYADIIWGG